MSRLFGPTRQLGVVVHDFQGALQHWTQVLGIGPFFYFTDMPVSDYHYRGQPAEAPILSIAFGYSGDLQIEIIYQQNTAASPYLDFLATGREGLQHVSGFCSSEAEFDTRTEAILAAGIAPLGSGAIGGTRFAYFDTGTHPGATVSEISESGKPGPRELFDSLREICANWDGSDPIRPLAV